MASAIKLPPPTLPNWRPRVDLSRPTAEQINDAENRQQTLTFAGFNEPIPIVYGEQIVSGPLIAGPVVSGGYVVYAAAVCWAGANGIEQILDARVGGTITALPAIATPATGRQVGDWWVYDGRQTAVNPWLSAAIPGFNDVFTGVAYVAARFSTSATSWPQPSFRVSGRKCRDPRTSAVAWTENPVLHMLDFVTNDEFGMGVQMRGASGAADIADSLYSGLPRSRSGLCIQDAAAEDDILPLLAGYAEVLWGYDGADVVVVPDAPAAQIHDVPVGQIRGGSISLSTVDLQQIPTLVQITFTDRSSPEGWTSRPARASAPEHTLHGAYTSVSTVALPGLFNRIEAERRAWQRLQRLQVPGRINWQMMAPGMAYQAGDVVRLPNVRGLQSVDVRITAQPEMVAPDLWQMGGEIYRADQYPDGSAGTVVPVGAILLYRGSGAPPFGWEMFAAPNGRLLREGTPGAAGTVSAIARSVQGSPAGGHTGQFTAAPVFQTWGPNWSGLEGGYVYHSTSAPVPVPDHTHQFSVNFDVGATLPQRRLRFVRKTVVAALMAPGTAFFTTGPVSAEWVSESVGVQGGFVAGGASEQLSAAISSLPMSCTTQPGHTHAQVAAGRVRPTTGLPIATGTMGEAAGIHAHAASAALTATLRSYALAVYESTSDPLLPNRAIVGWEGAAAPAGWSFCDGSNGTPDLREKFIFITSAAAAGADHQAVSSVRIQIGASAAAGAHSHGTTISYRDTTIAGRGFYHAETEPAHSHQIGVDETVSLDGIVRYQLRFIQYTGG